MQRSTTRIRTSHVGRLPPPKGWEDMPARLANGEITDAAEIAAKVDAGDRRDGASARSRSASTASTTASSGPAAASPITPRISPGSRRGRWLPMSRRPPVTRPASATNSRNSTPRWTEPARCSSFPARSRRRRSRSASSPAARSSRRDRRRSAASSTPSRRRSRRSGADGRGGVRPGPGARLARSFHLQRILQDRRGIPLRAGRRAARGIPRGRRCRLRPADRRSGPAGLVGHAEARAVASRTTANSPSCASTRSTTRSPAFPRTRCAIICAGAAGTARTPTICRSSTSSTSSSK